MRGRRRERSGGVGGLARKTREVWRLLHTFEDNEESTAARWRFAQTSREERGAGLWSGGAGVVHVDEWLEGRRTSGDAGDRAVDREERRSALIHSNGGVWFLLWLSWPWVGVAAAEELVPRSWEQRRRRTEACRRSGCNRRRRRNSLSPSGSLVTLV
ncbi:hypothetical protein LINPERPRIM_LOCUS31229 [Linum perenne]